LNNKHHHEPPHVEAAREAAPVKATATKAKNQQIINARNSKSTIEKNHVQHVQNMPRQREQCEPLHQRQHKVQQTTLR
jgi:hypothetical protein